MSKESFKDFKRICWGHRIKDLKEGKKWWIAPFRYISIYITWVLVKTPITANFVTLLGIAVALTGLILIGLSKSLLIIIGFIFLYLYFILDAVDGEIARYKKQTSVQGIFYDEIGHYLIHTGLFFAFGYSIYTITSEDLFLILGILASFSILGIRMIRLIPLVTTSKGSAKKVIKNVSNAHQNKSSKKGFIKVVFLIIRNIITAFCTTIIIKTVYFVSYLIYIFYDNTRILKLTMIYYSIFIFIMFLLFMIVRSRTIEKDVIKYYKIIKGENV